MEGLWKELEIGKIGKESFAIIWIVYRTMNLPNVDN